MCTSIGYLMRHFLPTKSLSDASSFIGFTSNAECTYPPNKLPEYDRNARKDTWKCDDSEFGFYSPKCRSWYKLQSEYPDVLTAGDLYEYMSGGIYGLTFCVPLKI